MKKVCMALVLALALMFPQTSFASAPPQQDVFDIKDYIAENFEDYDVIFIDIDPKTRLSDTATIPRKSIAIISQPFSMVNGGYTALSFTMTRKTEKVLAAVVPPNRPINDIVFEKFNIQYTSKNLYTYKLGFYVRLQQDYYWIIENSEEDSISISNTKITIPSGAVS